jgi:hypothetical protein
MIIPGLTPVTGWVFTIRPTAADSRLRRDPSDAGCGNNTVTGFAVARFMSRVAAPWT